MICCDSSLTYSSNVFIFKLLLIYRNLSLSNSLITGMSEFYITSWKLKNFFCMVLNVWFFIFNFLSNLFKKRHSSNLFILLNIVDVTLTNFSLAITL